MRVSSRLHRLAGGFDTMYSVCSDAKQNGCVQCCMCLRGIFERFFSAAIHVCLRVIFERCFNVAIHMCVFEGTESGECALLQCMFL